MKKTKFLPIFLLLCLAVYLLPAQRVRALPDPGLESRAAIVMDLDSGEVYYSKNPDAEIYPASTTKIMTVLLAVEDIEQGRAALTDEVTASENMAYDLLAEGSTAGIQVGETMSLENLLYCAMLSSANEACNIIAEYLSGTVSAFVERMNQRAAELGCYSTHFANTHGLPNSAHYSTPTDFCRIAQEAASHSLFMRICNTESYDVPATNLSAVRNLVNSNALISGNGMYGSGYLYPDAKGIKTGYTNDAGYCLVSTASRNGVNLLAVVFGGKRADSGGKQTYTNFSDSIRLYDWVFENFSFQEVLSPGEDVASVDVNLGSDADYVNLRPSAPVTLLLPNDYDPSEFKLDMLVYSIQQGETVTAPVTVGEVLGEVSVLRNGQNCGTVKLVASSSVDLSRSKYIKANIAATLGTATFRIVAGVTVLIFAAYLVWVIIYRVRYHRYRRASARAVRRQSVAAGRKNNNPSIEFFPVDEDAAAAAAAAQAYHRGVSATDRGKAQAGAPAQAQAHNRPSGAAMAPEAGAETPGGADTAQMEGASGNQTQQMFQDPAEEDYFAEFFGKK